jgi:hypothetical protein
MSENGLEVVKTETLNKRCAKTWDVCLDIIKNKAFWALAVQNGVDFVHYLKAFKAMREGFASGNFIYGLIVAKKQEKWKATLNCSRLWDQGFDRKCSH